MAFPGDDIDDQPVLVVAEVVPADFERAPDAARGAVAGDQVAGGGFHDLPCVICGAQGHGIAPVLERLELEADVGGYVRMLDGGPAQPGIDLGLVEHGDIPPAARSESGPFGAEQPLPLRVREPGPVAGTQRLQQDIEFLTPADALKRPHHLAVHGHCPGQCKDLAIALESNSPQARTAE